LVLLLLGKTLYLLIRNNKKGKSDPNKLIVTKYDRLLQDDSAQTGKVPNPLLYYVLLYLPLDCARYLVNPACLKNRKNTHFDKGLFHRNKTSRLLLTIRTFTGENRITCN
jgi:hypothetical protein